MLEVYGIIYKITNKINGKIYIGQTINSIEYRFSQHSRSVNRNVKVHSVITKAIKKHGAENFSIEKIDEAFTKIELDEKEIRYINELNSIVPNGYNLAYGGSKGIPSDESKLKMSIAQMGKKLTPESIAKRHRTKLENNGYAKSLDTQRRIGPKKNRKYKGVTFQNKNKYNKYLSIIKIDGKAVYLGSYRTRIEAAYHYNVAVDKYLGGNAYKNEIDEFELYNEINKSRELTRHGLSYNKSTNSWNVVVCINDKRIHIGVYKSTLDAKIAYNDYVIRNNLDKPLNWADGKWLI